MSTPPDAPSETHSAKDPARFTLSPEQEAFVEAARKHAEAMRHGRPVSEALQKRINSEFGIAEPEPGAVQG